MLKVDLKLDPKSEKYLNDLSKRFDKGLSKGLIKGMLFAEGEAKSIFKESGPVLPPPGPLVARTGHLRRSIRAGVNGSVGWIGTEVKYGVYHELGLGRMPKRPFLAPSFQGKNLERVKEIIINGIFKEIKI